MARGGVLLVCVLVVGWVSAVAGTAGVLPPVVLIPGFASSRLLSWSETECGQHFDPAKAFAVGVGQRIWLDSAKVVMESFVDGCWLSCMQLNYYNQTDNQNGCKIRAAEGIEAIKDLDPGLVTGPLSAVFKDIINELTVRFGYEAPLSMMAAPYDFRLPPLVLETRDRYFTRLRHLFERLREYGHRRAIVIAHSLGNNVFRYFIAFIQKTVTNPQEWLDNHIKVYIAAGYPARGAPQAVKAVLSGETFGLPITKETARNMSTTFGSAPWMFVSKGGDGDFPQAPVQPVTFVNSTTPENTIRFGPYTLNELFDYVESVHLDEQATRVKHMLKTYYESDPLLNVLADPPTRPPIENVHCVYGIDVATEVGYVYESGNYDRDNTTDFRMSHEIIELPGGRVIRRGTGWIDRIGKSVELISTNPEGHSGDGTVPYYSLAYCKAWHTGEVKITHVPAKSLSPKVERERALGLALGLGLPSVTTDLLDKLNAYLDHFGHQVAYVSPAMWTYESETPGPGGRVSKTTTVEFEGVDHRDIIKSPRFFEMLTKHVRGYIDD